MAKLMIMESPHKAKTVGNFLGKEYKVLACTGHLIDLPKSKLGIDVNKGFAPQYTMISAKKDIAEELKKEAAKADVVLLATDPDREGEAISWHLASLLKIPENACCRLEFNSITKSCVTEAVKAPRKIDMDLVNAQQARRVLDRLVGYEISPILWHKIRSGLSAGRVQSAVTKMVVDREREIESFVPEEFWNLDAQFSTVKPKKKFTARFFGNTEGKLELKRQEDVVRVQQALENAAYGVSEYKEGSKHVNAQPPFTTSALQQDAAHKLGFSTKKTMMLAQQLYEGIDIEGIGAIGLVTYIRTDSVRVAPEALDEVRAYIASQYDEKYLPAKPNVHKTKKNSQDAHEAIRPSSMTLTPERVRGSLSTDQYKLYKLIFERFVASQMASAKYATISVTIASDNGYLFKASASKRVFDGFMALYFDKDEEAKSPVLPEMKKGDAVTLLAFDPSQHFTQPPLRYNEASLVKEMEAKGIGRPSTYASTVSTILDRDYIERDKKQLKPTSLGITVTDMISENFSEIVDLRFTANMESKLDDIENGTKDWVKVVSDFYAPFKESLDKANRIERVKIPVEETEEKCPNCGANMVIRSGRFGKFLACPNYPACKTTKPLPQDEIKECCPKCGGKLVQRISKKGKKFYGCSNYPNCDFASAGLPTGEKCPQCGGFLVRGFKGKIMCNSFDCNYGKKKQKESGENKNA